MNFEEWWGDEPKHGMITAREAWKAAQAADRERIKGTVREAAESLWLIPHPAGKGLYIGPSLDMMEQFVELLLEE